MTRIKTIAVAAAAALLVACDGATSHAVCTDDAAAAAYSATFVRDLVAAGESGKHPFKLTDQTQIDLLGVESRAKSPAEICNWIDTERRKLGL